MGSMSRPNAKLTVADVVEIRELIAAGASNLDLAPLYGVSVETIRRIRHGHRWRNLGEVPRTHCYHDHPYAEHGYLDPKGKRRCRACERLCASSRRPSREEYLAKHEGHELRTRTDGAVFCLSCWRGEAYVDEIAVERAVAGDPPEYLTVAERAEAIDRLLATGMSQLAAARRLKISVRTVQRRAAELRKAAA
ncbi:hypothetical protein CcI49_02815 [Frankia sp. CcI49]|nr:hypothetical protein CcI49_02815 [Frankia sp. CcI49]